MTLADEQTALQQLLETRRLLPEHVQVAEDVRKAQAVVETAWLEQQMTRPATGF